MVFESTPTQSTDIGYAFGCSRTGASHIRINQPCQDAYSIWSGSIAASPLMIIAVADGHGDQRHDQSQYGATLAVKAATDELFDLFSHFGLEEATTALKSNFKSDFPRLVERRWRNSVLQDAQVRLNLETDSVDEGSLYSRYGTTLLVALVMPNVVLIGQIGDGDVLFVRADGTVDRPFQRDISLVGTVTHSLSSQDALLWQTATREIEEDNVLMLSTDGLFNAFADEEQFQLHATSLSERISKYGVGAVYSKLPEWLDDYSIKGSGDDITLAVAYIRPANLKRSEENQQNQEKSRIQSIGGMNYDPQSGPASQSRDAESQPDSEKKTR